ncbi:MAG: YdeI/OmpD-associated family protein [Niabella sp.]
MKPQSIRFTATLQKFEENGEKTGWTYIDIPAELAGQLKPGNKKSFRVKGKLDNYPVAGVSLLPMGGGDFIMAVNAAMRRGVAKKQGAMVNVVLTVDEKAYQLNKEFIACLTDEPVALAFFKTLTGSHQNYFSKWIDSAKTEATKVKRITMAVSGLARKMDYGQMMRYYKENRV